jgi:hypothetical protein
VPAADTAALRVLREHGVITQPLPQPWSTTVECFTIDSVHHAERPFQGHHETTLFGKWNVEQTTLPAGTVLVRTAQPLGLVAFYLLEPLSDDGLTTWNFFDPRLKTGADFPVLRVPAAGATLNQPR